MSVFNVNGLRAAIIRDLSQHPGGETTGGIAKRIDVDYRQVYAHLRTLLAEGLVRDDGEQGPSQSGRRVLYRIDQEQLRRQFEAYVRFLSGK
ncbi:helix-turn-helix domain-containing protein [Paenarthrobacter sp. NPDC057355]|uniref:helix-turn-helix domain-containing protein n=1 Tax=Paenarthrobacter sp. NPDC057355 TaxID=3346105 RepID=UPI00362CD8A3